MIRSHKWLRFGGLWFGIAFLLIMMGCGAASLPIVPTAQPTVTATPTSAPTRVARITAIPSATPPPPTRIGGPSATPLFGATRTPAPLQMTETRAANPNAPRIEFFTANAIAIAPGDTITLYWSTRNTTSAVIYQLDRGIRNQLWNVGADGSLPVPTNRRDRGTADFELVLINGDVELRAPLSIPLACPDVWFFQPAPESCPAGAARETRLIEQPFQSGRMLYIEESDLVYGLFNDGFEPAWVVFDNLYDPAVDPESDPNFPNPPGFYQPLTILGKLWRSSDAVRNRLGLGAQPEFVYQGFIQSVTSPDGDTTLYLSSADGSVLQLLPEGAVWQLVTPQ